MSARSFHSVFMVASCAGAALGCYLVSLRVASERAALEQVETRIVLAQRDIRLLQTEIGTRGRLAQLERWNAKVLALSAPSADQFLDGGFALARLTRPPNAQSIDAPVVLASAPAPQQNVAPLEEGEQRAGNASAAMAPAKLLRQASLTVPPVREQASGSGQKPSTNPGPAAAASAKAPAPVKAEQKPVRTAAADPLAPLPGARKPAPQTRDPGQAR